MKNIYLLLFIGLFVGCSNSEIADEKEVSKHKEIKNIGKEPTVKYQIDLTADASFEGDIFKCMSEGFFVDNINLESDLKAFHKVLVDLKWLTGGSGKDYYDLLQSRTDYIPNFVSVPDTASVFADYPKSGARMSTCKLNTVEQRSTAYTNSTMFHLDNLQSAYKKEGSVYLQLLEIYKNELSIDDLEKPYYKFSVQYIIYLYWANSGSIDK